MAAALALGDLAREMGRRWTEHKVMQLSAALAYYSIFSIAPLLVIAVAIAGWAFGPEAVRGQLDDQLQSTMGPVAADAVQSMVKNAYQPGRNAWAAVIGVVTLLLGASGVFGQLKEALNAIWEAPPPARSRWGFVRERAISFGIVLVIGFLLLTSLVLTATVAALWEWLSVWLPLAKVGLTIAGFIISTGITTTLLALIFKWLPDAPVSWREAWTGGIATALWFEIGKGLLGIYLGRESAASSYGAAGAVIVILLWVYYTSIILLSGACFTCAYHHGRSAGATSPAK